MKDPTQWLQVFIILCAALGLALLVAAHWIDKLQSRVSRLETAHAALRDGVLKILNDEDYEDYMRKTTHKRSAQRPARSRTRGTADSANH